MKRILRLAALALFLTGCAAHIDTGNYGVVTQGFGQPTGQVTGPGLQFYNPFGGGVHSIYGQVRTEEFKDEEAVTSDRQEVKTTVVIQTQLNPAKVVPIYTNYRGDVWSNYVDPTVRDTVKAITAKYDAKAQVQNRDRVRQDMEDRLRAKLEPIGVRVVGLNITNFQYNQAYQDAIEQTAVSLQNRIKAQADLQVAQIVAQQKIVEAHGQAQAQRELAAGVTQKSLGYLFYQKWDGKLPTFVGTGASGLFSIPGGGE